jgi:hypothetical protein
MSAPDPIMPVAPNRMTFTAGAVSEPTRR